MPQPVRGWGVLFSGRVGGDWWGGVERGHGGFG